MAKVLHKNQSCNELSIRTKNKSSKYILRGLYQNIKFLGTAKRQNWGYFSLMNYYGFIDVNQTVEPLSLHSPSNKLFWWRNGQNLVVEKSFKMEFLNDLGRKWLSFYGSFQKRLNQLYLWVKFSLHRRCFDSQNAFIWHLRARESRSPKTGLHFLKIAWISFESSFQWWRLRFIEKNMLSKRTKIWIPERNRAFLGNMVKIVAKNTCIWP